MVCVCVCVGGVPAKKHNRAESCWHMERWGEYPVSCPGVSMHAANNNNVKVERADRYAEYHNKTFDWRAPDVMQGGLHACCRVERRARRCV